MTAARLASRLRALLGSPPRPAPARWAVLGVEASGPDAKRDRLLAIAAVALRLDDGARPVIDLGDSFEVVLRGAQREGVEPRAALEAFVQWLGDAPLVAFHAAFDASLIQRALQSVLGSRLANPWLDLAPVAAAVQPQVKARSLDDWLAHFAIPCAARHQAAADTLATAELLLRLWPAIRARGTGGSFAGLARLAAQGRWLQR